MPNANTATAGRSGVHWRCLASHQPTASFNLEALGNSTSLRRPLPKPAHVELSQEPGNPTSGWAARSGGPSSQQSQEQRRVGAPLPAEFSRPAPTLNHRLLGDARGEQKRQPEAHLLRPPPGSSCRGSSRPAPRRRR